jgi:hypothetical protein
MYTQNFTGKELYSLLHRDEREQMLSRWETEEQCIQKLDSWAREYIEGVRIFKFKKIDKIFKLDDPVNGMEWIVETSIMRKLYRNLHGIYKCKQSNRNQIVNDVRTLLNFQKKDEKQRTEYIYRMDIKSFYESISVERLLSRFQSEYRLSSYSIDLLKKLYSLGEGKYLLKRGLSMSALLSEIYMQRFDFKLRSHPSVIYYARFVDDIIIFLNQKDQMQPVHELVETELNKLDLQLNVEKEEKIFIEGGNSTKDLIYLGYQFTVNDYQLVINIADNKVEKIKRRIQKSIAHYAVSNDYALLKDSIRYLTGNTTVYMPYSMKELRTGIYYNYSLITEGANNKSLKSLDAYYRMILNARSTRLGKMIYRHLSEGEVRELNKYSFCTGFEKKIYFSLSAKRLAVIKKCWL